MNNAAAGPDATETLVETDLPLASKTEICAVPVAKEVMVSVVPDRPAVATVTLLLLKR